MAYKKTNWQDTLRDAQGNVIQKGTPLNAQALGKIEDGIVQAEQKIDTEIQQVAQQLAQKTQQLSQTILDNNVVANSRIDNLIIQGGKDSSPEVIDSKIDIKGTTHSLLNQRLTSDTSLILGINNNQIVPTYTNGKLTKVEEKQGNTVIQSTELLYSVSGILEKTIKKIGTKTVEETLNYVDGVLTSVTRLHNYLYSEVLIFDMESISGWYVSGTSTISLDTTKKETGSNSLKIASSNDALFYAMRNGTWSFKDDTHIRLWIAVDDLTKLDVLKVSFNAPDDSNQWNSPNLKSYIQANGVGQEIIVPKSLMTAYGTPKWNSITKIWVGVKATTGNTVTVWVDNIKMQIREM